MRQRLKAPVACLPRARLSLFFFEPVFLSSACPHVSLSYPEYSGFLIAATQAIKLNTKLNMKL